MQRHLAILFLAVAAFLQAAVCHQDLSAPLRVAFPQWGQTTKVITDNGAPAAQITWDAAKATPSGNSCRGEFWFVKNTLKLDAFTSLKMTLTCRPHPDTEINHINIRFRDAQEEILQIPLQGSFNKGTSTLTLTIKGDEAFKSSWGKTKNGKLDFPVTLAGFSVHFGKDSGKGGLDILDISADVSSANEIPAAPLPVVMDIETRHPARIITPEDKGYIVSVIRNTSSKKHTAFTAKITVRDIEGNTLGTLNKHFNIGPSRVDFFKMPAVPTKYGVYYVTAKITPDDAKCAPSELNRSFAVANLTGHTVPYQDGQFRFSVHMHWWPMDPADMKIKGELAQQIGIRFVRSNIWLGNVMGGPNKFDFDFPDAHVDYLRSIGLYIEACMGGTGSDWAHAVPREKDDKYPSGILPKAEIWEQYCNGIFQHFRGRVYSFELWNEPDLFHFCHFSAEDLARMARVAKKAHDTHAPEINFMSPGFCSFDTKDAFHEKLMANAADCFNAHCWHGHGAYRNYRHSLEKSFFPMREKLGITTLPWYPHETAITSTGYTEAYQAETLWKKLIYSWSKGAIGYTWYDIRNDGFDPKNTEHNYGMVTRDAYPKAVYIAYNALIGIFNGPTQFRETLTGGSNADIFLFQREKDLLLCLWSQNQKTAGSRLFFTDATSAEIIDIYGNAAPLPIRDKKVVVPLAETPHTLRLKNATVCRQIEMPLSIGTNAIIFTNNKAEATLTIKNTEKKPVSFLLDVKCPSGISQRNHFKPGPITLKPNETATRSYAFSSNPRQLTTEKDIVFTATTDELGTLELGVPAHVVTTLPKKLGNTPYFVLDKTEQVFEFFDANPGERHRLRTGNDDLSAKAYLAGDAKQLNLRIEVTDDVHKQPRNDSTIWKADSIQLYIAFPSSPTLWQFGCALTDDGNVAKALWNGDWKNSLLDQMDCTITRQGTTTTYLITIPWKAFNISQDTILKDGFSFSFLVNESDSDVREAWIQATQGVGNNINSTHYPAFIVTP